MAKLIYKTLQTPKGHDFIKSMTEHKYEIGETSKAESELATILVNNTMEYLLNQLKQMGYDSSKVIF